MPGSRRALRAALAEQREPARPRAGTRHRPLAAARGMDPNRWREDVERISLERIGEQTYRHVRNIDQYYLIYTGKAATDAARDAARRR